MGDAQELTGATFGRLRVLRKARVPVGNGAFWLCMCECGKTAIVRGQSLLRGHTKSCGCLYAEAARRANRRESRAITYLGKTQSIAAWARETGVGRATIAYRLKRGLPLEEVFAAVRSKAARAVECALAPRASEAQAGK